MHKIEDNDDFELSLKAKLLLLIPLAPSLRKKPQSENEMRLGGHCLHDQASNE